MIPLCISHPEPMDKVWVATVKDQLERIVKTLNKADTLHTEVSRELEALAHNSLDKELHTIHEPLTQIDDIIIYLQTEKHTYLEDNITPNYYRPFRESDIPDGSVAVRWN